MQRECVMLQLNPHLEATFSKMAGRGMVLPKQTAPAQSAVTTGISSFAFQGTNAHAVLDMPSDLAAASAPMTSSGQQHPWQKRHISVLPPMHASLMAAVTAAKGTDVTFEWRLQTQAGVFLYDHIVQGQCILPAAAYLEMIAAAMATTATAGSSAQGNRAISGAVFEAPLVLPKITEPATTTVLLCKLSTAQGSCKLASASGPASGNGHLQHMQARVSMLCPQLAVQARRPLLQGEVLQVSALATAIDSSFRKLVSADKQSEAVGIMTVNSALVDGYCVHPSLLDNSLQLAAAAAQPASSISHGSSRSRSSSSRVFIPAGLQALTVPSHMHIGMTHATAHMGSAAADGVLCDHSLTAPTGAAMHLTGMQSRAMHQSVAASKAADESSSQPLYEVIWQASSINLPTASPDTLSKRSTALMSSASDASSGIMQLASIMQQASKARPHSMGLQLQTCSSRLVMNGMTAGSNFQQAGLWGMMRTFQQECPAVSMTGKDTQTDTSNQAMAPMLRVQAEVTGAAKTAPDGYGHSERCGAQYTARLLPVDRNTAIASRTAAAAEMPLPNLAGGSVIITGGAGMIGSLVSLWMLKQAKPRSVTLLSRTGRASKDRTRAILGSPEAMDGALISIAMCNVTFAEDSHHCFAGMGRDDSPISAILHAGGVLADATVPNQSLSSIRAVFAPKVTAAQKWQHAVQQQPTQTQVLFSSVAALLGAPGQLSYAAANAAMDGLAATWQGRGQAGVSSIQWGGWAGGGMASTDSSTAGRLARMGMPLITPAQGLAALADVLSSLGPYQLHGGAVLSAVPFKWDVFMKNLPAGQTGIFAEFEQPASESGSPSGAALSKPTQRRKQTDSRAEVQHTKSSQIAQPNAVLATVLTKVSTAVASVLGTSVAAEASLMEIGLDSLGSVELRNTLNQQLGIELLATFALDYPNIGAMARYCPELRMQ